MAFVLYVRAQAEGGVVTCEGQTLTVKKANAVTLLLSAGTSFNGADKPPGREGRDPVSVALPPLKAAEKQNYAALLARHLVDYQKLFRRVEIDLGQDAGAGKVVPSQDWSPRAVAGVV
jgi:alpha-L-fucosidase 2